MRPVAYPFHRILLRERGIAPEYPDPPYSANELEELSTEVGYLPSAWTVRYSAAPLKRRKMHYEF